MNDKHYNIIYRLYNNTIDNVRSERSIFRIISGGLVYLIVFAATILLFIKKDSWTSTYNSSQDLLDVNTDWPNYIRIILSIIVIGGIFVVGTPLITNNHKDIIHRIFFHRLNNHIYLKFLSVFLYIIIISSTIALFSKKKSWVSSNNLQAEILASKIKYETALANEIEAEKNVDIYNKLLISATNFYKSRNMEPRQKEQNDLNEAIKLLNDAKSNLKQAQLEYQNLLLQS
jgi:hypothetical protein